MAEACLLDRLTASDLFLLMWDDYGWSTDIGGLAIVEGTGLLDRDGRVRIEDVRRLVERRLHQIPRFRQLLRRPRLGLGWPLWVDAPTFDIADHIRVHTVNAPGDEVQLVQVCQELARWKLDPARPLWELWVLPGLQDRRVAVYFRLHHAFADGAAALAAFGALLDMTPNAPTPVAPDWRPMPIPTDIDLLRDNLRRRGQELGRGWAGVTHPRRTIRSARETWPAWREVLAEEPAPRTSLNRPVRTARRLARLDGDDTDRADAGPIRHPDAARVGAADRWGVGEVRGSATQGALSWAGDDRVGQRSAGAARGAVIGIRCAEHDGGWCAGRQHDGLVHSHHRIIASGDRDGE